MEFEPKKITFFKTISKIYNFPAYGQNFLKPAKIAKNISKFFMVQKFLSYCRNFCTKFRIEIWSFFTLFQQSHGVPQADAEISASTEISGPKLPIFYDPIKFHEFAYILSTFKSAKNENFQKKLKLRNNPENHAEISASSKIF